MSWSVLYLILGIFCIVAGVWRLARGGNIYIVFTCILWFLSVLLYFNMKATYNYFISKNLPSLGDTIHFILVPIFLILSLYSVKRRY
jgi:hypothetical protein